MSTVYVRFVREERKSFLEEPEYRVLSSVYVSAASLPRQGEWLRFEGNDKIMHHTRVERITTVYNRTTPFDGTFVLDHIEVVCA